MAQLSAAAMRPAKSGCAASIPVSRTATSNPCPVSPPARTSGAPICATVSDSVAFTLPSGHTLAIPPANRPLMAWAPAVRGSAPVKEDQKVAASA
ncbi:hypothetical protein OH779_33680 [Actinacidiphila glaucinigra]|uniref:hypothetical protein n=1 Tax=Actinacidiphila glaucinigra TaxID=235986 RepID=UPI00386C1182